MIGINAQITDNSQAVVKAADAATFRNLGHAAASIRKDAIASIIPSDQPSKPGAPPHTRRRVTKKGKQLKGQLQRAITYDQDRANKNAVIGPRASVVGESGAAHEFGQSYKGDSFPERSFMGPALEANLTRFASDWAGSIGQ